MKYHSLEEIMSGNPEQSVSPPFPLAQHQLIVALASESCLLSCLFPNILNLETTSYSLFQLSSLICTHSRVTVHRKTDCFNIH